MNVLHVLRTYYIELYVGYCTYLSDLAPHIHMQSIESCKFDLHLL